MKLYILAKSDCKRHLHSHFDKGTAEEIVKKIYYTTKDGVEHHGAYWSFEQVKEATKGMQFKECVTDYDKYVALNLTYADLCKLLNEEIVIQVAHEFFFCDEDAPCNKVWIYANALF